MTVHRFWIGPNPPPYPIIDRYISSSYHTLDWTLDTLPQYAQQEIERTLPFVPEDDSYRHMSNIARLAVLLEHGGIWLDHDIIPLVNLEALPRSFIGSYGSTFPQCWSCIMGFTAHHPMLKSALKFVQSINTQMTVPEASGSRLYTNLLLPDITLHTLACDSTGLPLPHQYSAIAFHLSATSLSRHRPALLS